MTAEGEVPAGRPSLAGPTVSASAEKIHPAERGVAGGDWPHTSRVLPWSLAAFLVIVFLVPFDSAKLPISLPFDTRLDRAVIVPIFVLWLAALAAAGAAGPRFRRSPLNVVLVVFAAVAVTSVALNVGTLANVDDLQLALKKLVLLFSFVIFFFIVSSVVRPGEVRAFTKLILGLAVVTAIGTIVEYRTGTNLFYDLTDDLLPGFSLDGRESSEFYDATGRRSITGPTGHGLAVTTMLALVLPFAVVGILRSRERRTKLLYIGITALLLTGAIATVRKTAAIVPIVAVLPLIAYRPKAMMRLWPLGLAMLIGVHALVPGAMGSIKSQLFPQGGLSSNISVEGRTEDYDAVQPDLLDKPVIGRGYGTYDPKKYRLLDNEWLALRITVGWVGVAAYLMLILGAMLAAHRAIRSRAPAREPTGLAVAGAAVALLVASALFDSLAFPHVPYLFLFIGGLLVAASAGAPAGRDDPAPAAAAVRARRRLTPVIAGLLR